jgi:hypothetical protein
MKTYLLLATTDVALLVFTAFYLSVSDTLFLFSPLLLLSLGVCFVAALLLVLWRIFRRKERTPFTYAALVIHAIVALVAMSLWQNETYIDIAFQQGFAHRQAIATRLIDAHMNDKPPIFADWEPYQNGYWSPSKGVSFEEVAGVDYVMFTTTRGMWDYAGFVYISNPDAEPYCLSSSHVANSIKKMREQWYWLTCGSD